MEIQVLVEPVAANGYCARSGEPLGLTAEGLTAEEAVDNLRELIVKRVSSGTRLVLLHIPAAHSWAPWAGMFKDDPWFDICQQAIAERRKQIDEDPTIV